MWSGVDSLPFFLLFLILISWLRFTKGSKRLSPLCGLVTLAIRVAPIAGHGNGGTGISGRYSTHLHCYLCPQRLGCLRFGLLPGRFWGKQTAVLGCYSHFFAGNASRHWPWQNCRKLLARRSCLCSFGSGLRCLAHPLQVMLIAEASLHEQLLCQSVKFVSENYDREVGSMLGIRSLSALLHTSIPSCTHLHDTLVARRQGFCITMRDS